MKKKVVFVLFVALAIDLTGGAANAQRMGHWKCVGSLGIVFADCTVVATSSYNDTAYASTAWAGIVLASLAISGRTIRPKWLKFGEDDWICLRPEDYELLSEQVLHLTFLHRVIISLADRLGLSKDMPELAAALRNKDFNVSPPPDRHIDTEGLETDVDPQNKEELDSGLIGEAKQILSDPKARFGSLDEFIKGIAIKDLRTARQRKGISQKQLADMTGLTQSQISNLEKDPTSVSAKTLRKLAKALGVKIFI